MKKKVRRMKPFRGWVLYDKTNGKIFGYAGIVSVYRTRREARNSLVEPYYPEEDGISEILIKPRRNK